MPFKSERQRRYMHWARGQGLISPKVVEEYQAATPKRVKLPERAPKKEASVVNFGAFSDELQQIIGG
jgi:hypothetical protein